MSGPLLPILALLAFSATALPAAAAEAPEPSDRKAALVLDAPEDAELKRFSDPAFSAASRAFGSKGVSVRRTASAPDPESASASALASGCRWAVVLRVRLESRRLFWRISVYDAVDRTLRAADSFAAFAGLTALPLLDSSAASVAEAWARVKDAADPTLPVPHPLRFFGGDPEAAVRFASASVPERDAGTTSADGGLEAEYAPFMAKEAVEVRVSKAGYWPKSFILKKGPTEKPVRLPRLQKRADEALTASVGVGRLLGGAVAYRRYLLADLAFLGAENAAWIGTDFQPGSRPVLHDELRLGAGVYPFSAPDAVFRVGLGAGVSLAFTALTGASGYAFPPAGADFCVEPVWFTLEYHRPGWALVLETRFPYSVGLDSGFLPRGWLELDGGMTGLISLGLMRKW